MPKKAPVKTLNAALTKELHIDLKKNPIHVRLEGGSIVIEGYVDTIARKKRAVYIAMGIEGSNGVVDRFRVIPSKKMTDKEIKKHIEDSLTEEPTLQTLKIEVEINCGVVDIEGEVPSLTHKRLSGVLSWWVPGVTDVINSLEVIPPEEDSDDEIIDAVKTVFEKDRIVDETSITVAAKDWVVTLTGTVAAEAEKQAAEDDVLYVWVVNDCVNKLKVSQHMPLKP